MDGESPSPKREGRLNSLGLNLALDCPSKSKVPVSCTWAFARIESSRARRVVPHDSWTQHCRVTWVWTVETIRESLSVLRFVQDEKLICGISEAIRKFVGNDLCSCEELPWQWQWKYLYNEISPKWIHCNAWKFHSIMIKVRCCSWL